MGETYSLAEPIPVLNQLAGDTRRWVLRHRTEGVWIGNQFDTHDRVFPLRNVAPLPMRADAAITLAVKMSTIFNLNDLTIEEVTP